MLKLMKLKLHFVPLAVDMFSFNIIFYFYQLIKEKWLGWKNDFKNSGKLTH